MLMVHNPKPQSITPRANEILDILRKRGDWTTRAALAEALGKQKLNKWDVGLLELLADEQLIAVDRRPRPDGITLEYIYRAK